MVGLDGVKPSLSDCMKSPSNFNYLILSKFQALGTTTSPNSSNGDVQLKQYCIYL